MSYPLNKVIDSNGFDRLVLDYDIPGDGQFAPFVSCRVLADGYYAGRVTAETVQDAIRKFRDGEYRRVL